MSAPRLMDRHILVGSDPPVRNPMPPGTRVRYFPPAPGLRVALTGYNAYAALSSAPRVDRFLPAPAMICVSIDAGPLAAEIGRHRFGPLEQASVYGPTTRPLKMMSQGGVSIGIGVSPAGWARLGLGSAIAAQNRVVPLAEVLRGALADNLAGRLAELTTIEGIAPTLDAILAPLLATPHPDEPLILALAAIIAAEGNPDVADVADALGVPSFRLRRLATRHFGMTPKLLLRRARFLRSFLRDNGLDGAGRQGEIDESYFDLSHYLRDARTFLNTTPRRFLADSNTFLLGSIRARAAALGAPTQALHQVAAERPV